MKSFSLVVSGFILSIAVSLVHSFDLHFLKHSPARHFTKQDWEIAKTATRDILDNHSQGESVTWDNPDSGSSGDLKITRAGTSSGKLCKRLQITNRVKGQEHTSSHVFCKQDDGKWKAVITKK
ncbi:MAG: RT0821/Lpp0805 family surface protein [Candidatus Thiodiazotropha sp.]